ncbi:MAG: type II secretion system protein [Janthinobacterium lividum]
MSKKPDQMFSSQAGFSLLEMTIVLGILGILSTFALPKISAYRHHRAFCATQDHQERVIKGLESYLVHHGYLPRPDNFSDTNSEQFPQSGSSDSKDKSKNVIGAVPYDDLGLPESVTKDGYGNLMTYVVAHDACIQNNQKDGSLPFCKSYSMEENNLIKISDGKNNTDASDPKMLLKNVVKNEFQEEVQDKSQGKSIRYNEDNFYDKNTENYITFAIISHGPEGPHHAGSPEEEKNNKAHFDQHKISLSIRPYSVNPTKLFRHQIVWGTQQEFAGFCKSQKIIKSFDRFHQTFAELKHFADTMEKSSDIFKKLEYLISGGNGQPLDQKESSSLLKLKDSDDQLGQDTTLSESQKKSDLPEIPSGRKLNREPINNSTNVPLERKIDKGSNDHDPLNSHPSSGEIY